jgi:hypothetical protein
MSRVKVRLSAVNSAEIRLASGPGVTLKMTSRRLPRGKIHILRGGIAAPSRGQREAGLTLERDARFEPQTHRTRRVVGEEVDLLASASVTSGAMQMGR